MDPLREFERLVQQEITNRLRSSVVTNALWHILRQKDVPEVTVSTEDLQAATHGAIYFESDEENKTVTLKAVDAETIQAFQESKGKDAH